MDKRYDPIYQRGHQPANPQPTRQPENPPAAEGRPQPGRAAEGHRQPGRPPAPPTANQQGAPDQREVEVAEVTPAGERLDDDPPAPASAPAGKNPYLRLLAIVGALLAVLGIAAALAGGRFANAHMGPIRSVEEQEQAMMMMSYGQVLMSAGPYLLALGVGTMVGVGFVKAHRWQARHSD